MISSGPDAGGSLSKPVVSLNDILPLASIVPREATPGGGIAGVAGHVATLNVGGVDKQAHLYSTRT